MAKKPDDSSEMADFDSNADPFEAEEGGDFFEPSETPLAPDETPSAPRTPPPSHSPAAPSSFAKQAAGVDKKVVNLTSDIPVQIVAVLGKKSVTVKDVVSLRMGQVIELNRLPNEAVDLVAGGKLIAKGELVEIDGRLGVRILKIFD
jgi:type III secretion system YscQ/HrcQ family protein